MTEADERRLFSVLPEEFDRSAASPTLAAALGATLYMPATRPAIAKDLHKQGAAGVMSVVVCLEDAIADAELASAQANVVAQLRSLPCDGKDTDNLPLTFIRVRHPRQIPELVGSLGDHAAILSGFVLPKFTGSTGPAYLEALYEARHESGLPLLMMPVIESPEVVHRETRVDTLMDIRQLLDDHRDLVLAIRLGATDLSAAYGLRRDRDLTIYDVRIIAEVIADVVNILGRADGTGHVVTGPVWEYFPSQGRIFKPLLRQTPFDEQEARALRKELMVRDLDGLIREVVLDKANGLTGKTVIHPTHVAAVHALSVVTHEEHLDACEILGRGTMGGGAHASSYGNKMNETKPHRSWAERTVRRSRAFGVAAEDVTFVDLLAAAIA
ncbi:HpcH/HpaI aldolase/citrate lyase family protein [Aeromicrobium sp.]|uniref:HpcH/HpaI aldolase/citrate lyase family protein n=1 Tax=Aeromicrobium sp. TaxID=1871063 RepID=UPI0025C4E1FC|nr:HpcH/HpaI aldolase/citrate lyase family protein [Aeromicrobium sp.]